MKLQESMLILKRELNLLGIPKNWITMIVIMLARQGSEAVEEMLLMLKEMKNTSMTEVLDEADRIAVKHGMVYKKFYH